VFWNLGKAWRKGKKKEVRVARNRGLETMNLGIVINEFTPGGSKYINYI